MYTETVMFEHLLEETFNLIRELDETNDSKRAVHLQALIHERSEALGQLAGFALRPVGSAELLVACLDEEHAKAIQLRLLTTPRGYMTAIEPVMANIEDFVHPETDPTSVAQTLADDP